MPEVAITSDWQVNNNNLDRLKLFRNQLLKYCIKHDIKAVLHLGDLKHQYSPVDILAIIFSTDTIKIFKLHGIEWIQLLGNHDRSSMNDAAVNWMRVLRAAGAVTISRFKQIQTLSMRLAFVPYMSDAPALVNALNRVSDKADLLLFHNTIRNCKVNVQHSLNEGVSIKDLHEDRYKFCIGGHIHLPQALGDHTHFVGSPCSQDWGEANQSKRFLVYNSDTHKLKSIASEVPGMYNTSWPGFEEASPTSWKGAKIKVHVPCDTSVDIQKSLLKAKTKAEALYPKAEITTVPDFKDSGSLDAKNISTADDEVALKDYINSSCPVVLQKYKRKLFSYLKYKLSEKGYIRRSSQIIEFIEAEGKNFLCYKHLKINFKQKGIVVVTGVNKDWNKRSNGTGKTSFLNLPMVAATGATLKGQTSDKWKRRNSTGIAWAKLRLRLQDKRKCTLTRIRPSKLTLIVDGKDRSTGIGSRGTQQAFETLTGLTKETLKNAIYIDQTEVNEILGGSDTERKAIFSKLLNLERFDLAKELLKDELKKTTKLKIEIESDVNHLQRELKSYKEIAKDVDSESEYKAAQKKYRHDQYVYINYRSIVKRYLHNQKKKLNRFKKLETTNRPLIQSILNRIEINIELRGAYKKELEAFEKVTDTCPNCRQRVTTTWRNERMKMLTKGLILIKEKIDKLDKEKLPLDKALRKAEDALYEVDNKLSRGRVKVDSLQSTVEESKRVYAQYRSKEKLRYKYVKLIKKKKAKLKVLIKMLDGLSLDTVFINYGVTVFSKDGLPAYLINTLCPQLNIAAAKYSRLISEDEIRVKFKIDEDGAIYPKIKNAHGGEFIDDQSRGETRLASMITSFSVRDVINPANILILDEPGEGLDSYNAALFAQVLKEVSKRFGLILITSHNPIILAALEHEKHINIEKTNGIARIV